MGGNVDLYLKLLRTFTPDNKDLLLRLWEAYTKKDYETAFLLAHTLKGVAGNLGITQVYLAATDLEKSLEDGKSNVLELLKLVDKALQKAFMILESELPSKRSSKVLKQGGRQRKWDSKEVTRLCLELKQSLERHDLKAEGVLAEVASFLSEKYDEEVEGIAEEIDLLHFQEAVLRLKKLGELIHIEL
ncbi:MAG: Hpt domain-containing protein [Desulfobulbaceae bacterium]|nr:Hpt domain-containing protein [Desulfobulbaceae bacterium]